MYDALWQGWPEATMEEDNEDQRQFFSDLGASAEQAVQGVRGLEENYYMIHWAMPALSRRPVAR
jgi:hypothetical protein